MMPLEELCRQRGLRLTEHRRIVLEVMENATDHPCAREIHRRAAVGHRIGLATVYRAVKRLTAAGVLTRLSFPDGKARYERLGTTPHPHLIDVATGDVVEVDETELPALVAAQAARLGYRLVDFRLRLFGKKEA